MFAEEEHTHRSGPELYKINSTYKVPAPTEFNREKDWMERENVIDQYPEVAERLELHLNRFLLQYGQGETEYTGRMGTVYYWTPKK